ncbi:GNAT family N-acetyltransferase [Streptomyces sp. NPDC059786]|uniref:GNAT family N-acetyltransferase n=1 Tax=Streptomyces sp. NPDC059786 TaxID=3346946 RepID=UPI003650E715
MSETEWRWLRLRHPRTHRFFIHWPNDTPAGHQNIRVYDREGIDWARLVWKVCHECQRGVISKISLTPSVQRQGLGTLLIERALLDGPDYQWTTSPQSPDGKSFFEAMAIRTGARFTAGAKTCEHISDARTSRTAPVLDRRLQRAASVLPSWQ